MQIQHAVLEIFDFTYSLAVFSENELDLGKEDIQEYIGTHVMKGLKDPGVRTGRIEPAGPVGTLCTEYRAGNITIAKVGKNLGERLFEYMKQAAEPMVCDVIVCEAQAGATYLVILVARAHEAFTHQLFNEEDGSLTTELIEHRAMLPGPSQKVMSFAAINLEDYSVRIFEPKGEYDGETSYLLAERVLQLQTDESSRETIKKVRRAVARVAEAHESDGVKEMARAKELIAKNSEVSDTLDAPRLVEKVFSGNIIQQEAAKKELAEAGIVSALPVNRDFATKVGQIHKIKTDTGIEISFPVEYMKNREFLEIHTNNDGTLRIEVKNINKIINK